MSARSVDSAGLGSSWNANKSEIIKQNLQTIPRMRRQATAFNSELLSCAFVFPAIRFLNANVRGEGHISGACSTARLFAPREMTSRRKFLFSEHLHVARRFPFFPLDSSPGHALRQRPRFDGCRKMQRDDFPFHASMHTAEVHKDRF
jgi:hypothetical protein